jgi:hypothetical protein
LGFFEARKQFVDPIMRRKGGVPFVDEDATDVAQVSGWLSRRQAIEAFRLVCEILMTIGGRKHLSVLDIYSGTEEEADSLRENARYAVMRRSLI